MNYSDSSGGAAKAAFRIHKAICAQGLNGILRVKDKKSDDKMVIGPKNSLEVFKDKVKVFCLRRFERILSSTTNPVLHSSAIFSNSKLLREISASDIDLIHLHWINGEMLSVRDISKLDKKIVWTLHDMWAFCGAEHYTDDERWIEGYKDSNRYAGEAGVDINKWVWNRKLTYWSKPIQIVTPSRWLADCVKSSYLMRDWPVEVIPNAIDVDKWIAIEKCQARSQVSLPKDVPILLFGAIGGTTDKRKGFDLLLEGLKRLKGNLSSLELVIFGQSQPESPLNLGFPVHYTGHINEEEILNQYYSAADVFIIPSRQDNLPNTALESLASGTPIIAFDTGGLSDLINHKRNGYLVKAFDADDLATGIKFFFEDQSRLAQLSKQARKDAEEKYSYPVIGKRYVELYQRVLGII